MQDNCSSHSSSSQSLSTSSETEIPSLVHSLRNLVQEFMSRHSSLTLQALAQRSQVPVTTLRRLMQVESKSEIAPHIALNLCSYICREKKMNKLLEMLPTNLADYLKKHFGGFVFENAEERVYSHELNEILKDTFHYLIYKLAANRSGTSWVEVTELFGLIGKRKAENLIQLHVIEEREGKLHAKESDFSLDLKVAASHLPELVKYYQPENVGRGLNLMYSLSESLNEEAIKKIKDIQREAVQKTHTVMQSPESLGHYPYFTLNLCETFLSDEPAQKKGLLQ
jgi:hypothetical protein